MGSYNLSRITVIMAGKTPAGYGIVPIFIISANCMPVVKTEIIANTVNTRPMIYMMP
jgi:hypothetical protein